MKKTLIATSVIESPVRVQGTYQAAYRVTIGSVTGFLVHTLAWDKRDIEDESIAVSPSLEGPFRALMGDGFYDPAGDGFLDDGERVHDPEAMEQAHREATTVVYELL